MEPSAIAVEQTRMDLALLGPQKRLDIMKAAVAIRAIIGLSIATEEDSQPTRKKARK